MRGLSLGKSSVKTISAERQHDVTRLLAACKHAHVEFAAFDIGFGEPFAASIRLLFLPAFFEGCAVLTTESANMPKDACSVMDLRM